MTPVTVDISMSLDGFVRLFGELDGGAAQLEPTRIADSPAVTHLAYRVVK